MIAGKIGHEVNCVAVDNQESQRILAERTLKAMRPKLHTKYIRDEDTLGAGFIQPGTVGAQNSFNSFIVCSNKFALISTTNFLAETSEPEHEGASTDDEDRPYATKRTSRPYLQLL